MVRRRAVVALFLTLSATFAQPAAATGADRVRRVLEEQRRELHIPGLAFVVVRDDRVVVLDAIGLRDVERGLPATVDTLFPIGSCTKSFTAILAGIAQDEGRITLDDSPRRHLPWFEMQDPEANELVTLRDMLSHRTGLKPYNDLAALPAVLTREEYLRTAIGAKPVARLREEFGYSNAMVTAAAEAVARAYGSTWDRLVDEEIFAPLGMSASTTTAGAPAAAAAVGYRYDAATESWVATPVTPSLGGMAPAGSIASTARDLAPWLRMLTGNGALDGRRLIAEETLAEIVSPHTRINDTLSYALGWAVYDWNGHAVIEHNGGSDGLSALVSFMPDRRAGFAVLANSSPTRLTQIGALGNLLWPVLLGEPPAAAPTAPPHTTPAPAPPPAAAAAGELPAADELLERMVRAAGGRRNLSRHTTMRLQAVGSYAHHGVDFELTSLAMAPDKRVDDEVWIAAGRRIGRVRIAFDGTRGTQRTTFGQDEDFDDEAVAAARRDDALHPLLELRRLYGDVAVTGHAEVGGEDTVVLRLTPDTGEPVDLYVSSRTALVLRRDSGGESTTFFDFRSADGEIVPFLRTTQGALGERVVRVQELEFGVTLPAETFAPLPTLVY